MPQPTRGWVDGKPSPEGPKPEKENRYERENTAKRGGSRVDSKGLLIEGKYRETRGEPG